MGTLAIALKDIIIDPDRLVDLTTLPEQEAIQLIKESYGFLGPLLDVAIRQGVAIITLPDEQAQRAAEALKTYNRALSSAQRGDYKRVIGQLHQVIAALPGHVDARRNLGMAYLETSDVESAKDHIVEALKLDPRDAWSYVLLGNIYMKHEKNLDRADKLYRRALEISPNSAILLANYGALMIERGNPEQAEEFFDRAIAADPKYPHSYYNLALLALNEGRPDQALAAIDDMFARSESSDLRSVPVYDEARRLYLAANQAAAESASGRLMDYVDARRKVLEERGGTPIRLIRDESLSVSAAIETTWRHHRDHHVVRYRIKSPVITPHLVAHELEHLALELGAREAGRNRLFATSPDNREFARRSVGDHVYKLKQTGLTDAQITDYIASLIDGLVLQLFNAPLDMIIERRLFQELEGLRSGQFVSVMALHEEALQALTHPGVRRTAPPSILKANLAMNCATALFVDDLYGGKTTCAAPYRDHNVYATGQKLFKLWQDAMQGFKPGDEYILVDEFAKVLRLERWYMWKPDTPVPSLAFDRGGERLDLPTVDGATNAELLKAKESASVMHCLSALRRFEGMDEGRVREIAFEIALLGRFGLDYASPEEKYRLKSLPGEKFTGLELMCLMYVGFKRIDPTLNPGIDLQDAYTMALTLHRGEKGN